MVAPQHQFLVNSALLDSGMCILIPDEHVPRDTHGKPLVGGLFCVAHKKDTDRLINDRRVLNATELRLNWARLPHGCLLCQLLVGEGEHVRGDGDDLSKYFYKLRHLENWTKRNCFGDKVRGDDYIGYGAQPGQFYRLAFTVICMGDLNAVDIAQEVHHQLLVDAGCLKGGDELVFGTTVPSSLLWDGLYIDDHILISVGSKAQITHYRKYIRSALYKGLTPSSLTSILDGSAEFSSLDNAFIRARLNLDSAAHAYKGNGLDKAEDKAFRHQPKFVAWGTEVDDRSGRVGVPLEKRHSIARLLFSLIELGWANLIIMQSITGLLVPSFMHRRICMSSLHSLYTWMRTLTPDYVRVPPYIKDELCFALLLLPLAQSNVRAPVSTRLGATDSTTTMGGGVQVEVPSLLSKALYRIGEHRGEHVRLDWTGLEEELPETSMGRPQDEVHELVKSLPWKLIRAYAFRRVSHVNLQETRAVRAEVKDLAAQAGARGPILPSRHVNFVDSRVALGAVSKGRSSSNRLNAVLRSFLGYEMCAQIYLVLIWIGTHFNPSDDPTRHVEVRKPEVAPEWLRPFYFGVDGPSPLLPPLGFGPPAARLPDESPASAHPSLDSTGSIRGENSKPEATLPGDLEIREFHEAGEGENACYQVLTGPSSREPSTPRVCGSSTQLSSR